MPPGGPPVPGHFGRPPMNMPWGAGPNIGFKPGDWLCPNPACSAHNFASRGLCFKCSTKRPAWEGSSSGPGLAAASNNSRPGDWNCPQCQTMNFASRTSCFKCQKAKPNGSTMYHKEGDWDCEKCRTVNFAYRIQCFKCKADKPKPSTKAEVAGGGGKEASKPPAKLPTAVPASTSQPPTLHF